MENKWFQTTVAATLLVAVVGLVVVNVVTLKSRVTEGLGTGFTLNTSSGSYTDGADFRQNVQAAIERMTGLTQGDILQADSSGNMQAVNSSALSNDWLIDGKFTTGGEVNSSSTVGTAQTLVATDLTSYETLSITPNTADLTLTLPASSTLSTLVPSAGDRTSFVVANATSTNGIEVIVAGGTGINLTTPTSTRNVYPGTARFINCVREVSTDIECVML